MGLELVGGTMVRREKTPSIRALEQVRDRLADAQANLGGVRTRLEALLTRAAELRVHLGAESGKR